MMGRVRKLGVAALLLGAGVACTQLFGTDRENTLAPAGAPPTGAGMLNPTAGTTCEADQVQCNGALLQTCADDQRGWITLQRCAAAALCQLEPAACLPATCGADEMTCVGAVLQKCNADRSGWDVFATCASPAHCNADRRSCLPEACSPGERRCDRSDVDQSPLLEVCNEARLDWQLLDTCVTVELCAETLATAQAGGIVVGSDGVPQVAGPGSTSEVTTCLLPRCAAGEVRCEGSQLQYCAEGRTGFVTAEECATPALCQASTMNLTASGVPACLPPACAPGEHQCTEAGVLQVCNADRTGYRVIQACLGPAFCNAALANQGGDGCTAAPCEAGQMLCNGAQIQKCRDDRTGLDDTGTVCESAELCNADDPLNAFCEDPLCRRGATSSSEFRCEAELLQRCNESLTGYDELETCINAALCDASQRAEGCLEPECQPGDFACSEGLLQQCNEDQTGFENVENCGSQAACDANAGRCADPCEPGAVRCNNTTGDLEECVDPLLGWQVIGDCVSLPLCDAEGRTCRDPVCAVAGQRRCETRGQNPVVTQCSFGRDRFDVVTTCEPDELCDAQNDECDVCQPNSRRCEGNTLVVCDARGQTETRTPCAAGCATVAGQTRCLSCGPDGSARCAENQLFVCEQGPAGEFEQSEFCETNELCQQTLMSCGRGLQGQSCQCNDGVCRPNQLRCNGNALQRCNDGLTGFDTIASCGPGLCNAATGDCNTCIANEFSCSNGSLRQCAFDGRSFARSNIASGTECAGNDQVRVCNGGSATTQSCPNGCSNGRGCNECSGNGAQCINGNTIRRCVNGFFQEQVCAQGCNPGATQCNVCTGKGSSCINRTTQQQCVNGQLVNSNCPLGCVAGRCAACDVGQCSGDNFRACTDGQLAAAVTCPDTDRNPCAGGACDPVSGCTIGPEPAGFSCSDNNPCNGNETCDGNGFCNAGIPLLCPSTECRPNACNGSTGKCDPFNAQDGTPCRNGSAVCVGGVCTADRCGGTCSVRSMTPADRVCTASAFCDEVKGIPFCNGRPAAAGTPCTTLNGQPGTCNGRELTAAACEATLAPGTCAGVDASPCPQPGPADICSVRACVRASCTFVGPPQGTRCTTTSGFPGSCNGGQGPEACIEQIR